MPRRLGPYRLCMEIGAGGMSTVYLARVEYGASIQRFVALKRLRPHLLEEPTLAEMFFDEANIASQVHHPNVCSVLDFDSSPESQYIAMEYLMGEPLSSVRDALERDRERMGPGARADLVARVIADASEGLHATHETRDLSGRLLDVVHRDISPDNIFLTYDGTAKIVDFGVACAAGQKHETRTGVVKGKLAYLPPEVLTGQRPDRRADIWALGVVLWEMLTLLRLFRRENDVDTFCAIKECRVPRPSQVCPGLPGDLDAIVLRALASNPAERYATAREMGLSLQRALVGRGCSMGMPEVSQAMDVLFPSGRAHKRQLLQAASEIDDGDGQRPELPEVSRPPVPEVSQPSRSSQSSPAAGVARVQAVTMPPSGGTSVLHTRDVSLRFGWPVRVKQALHLTAVSALLMTSWFSYRIWSGHDAPSASAATAPTPTLAAGGAIDAEAFCAAEPTPEAAPVVLERGTYVLQVTGDGAAQLQVIRLDRDVAPPPTALLASADRGVAPVRSEKVLLARLAVPRPQPRTKQPSVRSFWRHRKLAIAGKR